MSRKGEVRRKRDVEETKKNVEGKAGSQKYQAKQQQRIPINMLQSGAFAKIIKSECNKNYEQLSVIIRPGEYYSANKRCSTVAVAMWQPHLHLFRLWL